jgi:L-fucose isomerase
MPATKVILQAGPDGRMSVPSERQFPVSSYCKEINGGLFMSGTIWCSSNFPKVGIRPVIDGRRRGVRESLEEQTMNMAKSAAKLISENLKYPDGTPVQCVIADTNIGGCAEAAACEAKFERDNVGVSLTVTPCWCYGTETMDANPYLPKAVWGFNGTERPGAV